MACDIAEHVVACLAAEVVDDAFAVVVVVGLDSGLVGLHIGYMDLDCWSYFQDCLDSSVVPRL